MNTELRKALRALGQNMSPAVNQATVALTAPHAPRPDPRHGRTLYDQAYGPHERHRIDLYGVRPGAEPRPMVLYVHGGGFVAGDKGGAEAPFYGNVGAWAAASGMLGATMNYRLAPNHPWPAGRDDVLAAVDWLARHASAWGGDARRIWVMGQSAGAAHVADAVAELTRTGRSDAVAGAVMASGLYDTARLDAAPSNVAYYGTDAAERAARSSLAALAETDIPCLFTIAELDPLQFQRQAAMMVQARLETRGAWPRMHWLAGHNHLSPMQTVGSAHDDVGPLLLRFMAEVHGD